MRSFHRLRALFLMMVLALCLRAGAQSVTIQSKSDADFVRNRGDVKNLPEPLKTRLAALADRPHSQLPTQAYAEAHNSSGPVPSSR